ncbi:hypothetical protein, partial [Candidatus Alkanophaga liquidiphilum]
MLKYVIAHELAHLVVKRYTFKKTLLLIPTFSKVGYSRGGGWVGFYNIAIIWRGRKRNDNLQVQVISDGGA